MAHVRKQIRDAVVTAVTGLVTTGSRVSASRVYPLEAAGLPALRVYATDEDSDVDAMTRPRGMTRELTVRIEAVDRATAALDDALDQICLEVETALEADPTLGGLARDAVLVATEIELTDGSQEPLGVARMDWRVTYRTREGAPGSVA